MVGRVGNSKYNMRLLSLCMLRILFDNCISQYQQIIIIRVHMQQICDTLLFTPDPSVAQPHRRTISRRDGTQLVLRNRIPFCGITMHRMPRLIRPIATVHHLYLSRRTDKNASPALHKIVPKLREWNIGATRGNRSELD